MRRLSLCLGGLGCALAMLASPARAVVPDVSVQAAPSGPPATRTSYDLAGAGYVERETFISGQARSYYAAGIWGANGMWATSPHDVQPYTSRVLARYPADPSKFNGTVVVEWFNTTSGVDLDMDMAYMAEEILAKGYAWVGVSAQQQGISGIQAGYPGRYTALTVPGSGNYSFDVFSQAAQAIRVHNQQILGGLVPLRLVATGLSQSAQYLVTYANAIQPVDQVFDGILIHGRAASGVALDLSQELLLPAVAQIRANSKVPVLQFQSEDDVFNQSFVLARQPDSNVVRTWEVTGSSHIDQHLMDYFNTIVSRDTGKAAYTCPPLNVLPTYRVTKAALRAINNWMQSGSPPPSTPRIATTLGMLVSRDVYGFTLGGIQQPDYAVPLAYNGTLNLSIALANNLNSMFFCILGGYSSPMPTTQIRSRYKSMSDYLAKVQAAAQADVSSGVLLPEDLERSLSDAQSRALPLP